MPAERDIEFGIERLSVETEDSRMERVSEMVLREGVEARRETRDSIAATGMVNPGSEAKRDRYVDTMLVMSR